ncbi:MAG: AmmeMemoRadiSam system protein B [Chloroflexota bacterium]
MIEPSPRLRPSVDVARVQAQGRDLLCLFDRLDPELGQVLISPEALDLVALLDGSRSVSAVRAAYMLRTGESVTLEQVRELVQGLDEALLLEGPRFEAHEERQRAEYRSQPVRAAVHAGGAYPGEEASLRAFLAERYTMPGGPGRAPGGVSRGPARGLIAPHIDLHRGGHSYAWGYGALAEREPAAVYLLFGTSHRPMTLPFAITAKAYDTPLGALPADHDLVEAIARRAPVDLFTDERMHEREHALEFQAVYLKAIGHAGEGAATVVPILCAPPMDAGSDGLPTGSALWTETIQAIRAALDESGKRWCVVAGADFAHVGPQFGDPGLVDAAFAAHVRAGDLAMLEHVARGDLEGFFRQVVDEPPGPGMAGDSGAVGGARRICGLSPMLATLAVLADGGTESRGEVLHYDQWIAEDGSGSVTFGCVEFA